MSYQDDIDSVLSEAQSAVNALADDVSHLSEGQEPPPPAAAPMPRAATTYSACAASLQERVGRMLKLKVPVVVRVAVRTMSIGEVMKITPGTILEFSRGIEQDLDLMANNHQIGSGVAVKVNEHFGLRLTYVGDVRNRINSLRAS